MKKSLIAGIILAGLMLLVLAACDDDECPGDTTTWSHECLMNGSKLETPDNTDGLQIAYLTGDHYRMGYQHGYLLKDQIVAVNEYLHTDTIWSLAVTLMGVTQQSLGGLTFTELVEQISYQSIKDECSGIVAGSAGSISYDICLDMNAICFVLEHLYPIIGGQPVICSGFAAANEATVDGKLYHGRNLDWDAMDFILDYPTLFVYKPDTGYKSISIGWPVWVSVLSGMNEKGISVQSNENMAEDDRSLDGRSHLQMLRKIMEEAATLDEALDIVQSESHGTGEIFLISDGNTKEAAVVEMCANALAIRRLHADGSVTDGSGAQLEYQNVLMLTNHFEDDITFEHQSRTSDLNDINDSQVGRYVRLLERLTGTSRFGYPDLEASDPGYAYGKIDVEESILILRDPIDMLTRENQPCDEYENSYAVGNNHNVQSFVFVPEDRIFYGATGWDEECGKNVLYNPYIGYDLDELFSGTHSGYLGSIDPDYVTYE